VLNCSVANERISFLTKSNLVSTDSSVIPVLKSFLMIFGQNVLNRLNSGISGAKQRPINVENTSSSITS